MKVVLARWRSNPALKWTLLVLALALISVTSLVVLWQPTTIELRTVTRLEYDKDFDTFMRPRNAWKSDHEVVISTNDDLRPPLSIRDIATGSTKQLIPLQALVS